LDLRLGQLMQGIGGNLPITSLDARVSGAFQTPSGVLGLGDTGSAEKLGPGFGKDYDAFLKHQVEAAKRLEEDAEKALASGLEAGISAFLDGGIGSLGEATYSLSKQAFGKALIDGVMSDQLKDA